MKTQAGCVMGKKLTHGSAAPSSYIHMSCHTRVTEMMTEMITNAFTMRQCHKS